MPDKYNICPQCCWNTPGCADEGYQCFYPRTHEDKLVCPYCGFSISGYDDLAELGLTTNEESNIKCLNCKNEMFVQSFPTYSIIAMPASESAVVRRGVGQKGMKNWHG